MQRDIYGRWRRERSAGSMPNVPNDVANESVAYNTRQSTIPTHYVRKILNIVEKNTHTHRERERETERERERERQRETDRQTDRQTETERQRKGV